MLRKILPAAMISLFVVVGAVGQDNDPASQLRQHLLSQDEIKELLGETWFIDGLAQLDPLPDGALISATATYDDGNGNTVIIGLVNFEIEEGSAGYIEAFTDSPIVASVRDLKEETEENEGLLSELIMEETDQVILLQFANNAEQLMLRRGTLAIFMRASPESNVDLTGLLGVADIQIQKILDFCENTESEIPSYC